MLASRMVPRESIITPRHGDCECRRARRHRSKGCVTARGGGNASETSAEIIQISACRRQPPISSCLSALFPPWQAVMGCGWHWLALCKTCDAQSANDCVNGL